MSRPAEHLRRFRELWRRGIWEPAAFADRSWRGRGLALLRLLSITGAGLAENHLPTRAAALSYASLLGLGPLVAIALLVAGFMLHQQDPAVAVNAVSEVLRRVAPQLDQYDQAEAPSHPPGQNPAVTALLNTFVAGSRSSTAGVVGALTLILIVIQLFTSVENAFNAVWGVRRGRSWMLRIIFYWTVLTLGAVLFFASLAALSVATFIHVFFGKLPHGAAVLHALQWMLPALSVLLLVGILTLFYRYIPNTRVRWRPALAGALLVTALLFLNDYLAFLYFRRVVLQSSLYGSVGIVPVLMLGLYVFWFFMLVGGQVSYAVQNLGIRSSQAAWHHLSEAARESLALQALVLICRRFRDCAPPCTATDLGRALRLPTQIVNECLNRLSDLQLVAAVPPAADAPGAEYRYQPARPPDRIPLAEFRRRFARFGDNPPESAERLDPGLRAYRERLARADADAFGAATLATLLDETPPPPAH